MNEDHRIFVVDDDESVLTSIRKLLEVHGMQSLGFSSAEEFLSFVKDTDTGCLITDLRLTGMHGDELVQKVVANYPSITVIVVSGAADVETAVRVMECGAITLIQKPWEASRFVQTVSSALQRSKRIRIDQMHADGFQRKLDSLTDEERLVLDCIVEGRSNKEVVAMLYMSDRTLDRRRATVFEKMGVETAVQLASMMERFRSVRGQGNVT